MGRFIAIEGGDGSGKGTQTKLLVEYAKKQGIDVLQVSFPRYGNPSAYYVEQYLNGRYGENDAIPADLSALPYALDRFGAREEIVKHLEKENSLVVADRYVASNLAHQGAKLSPAEERQSFYEHTMRTEYAILGIPKPDLNIVLLVPSAIAQNNVDKKAARSYTDRKRDILEADAGHLEKAKQNYEELCRLYPDEFTAIDCMNDAGEMRTIDDIQSAILEILNLRA